MTNFYREHRALLTAILLILGHTASAQLNVALQTTNPTCGGFPTGSITAIPLNGNPPFTYLWSTGATSNIASNLFAGTYSVTVTDFVGVTGSATTTLTEPPPLLVTILISDCVVPGAMEAIVQGGIGPYEYQWNNGETTPSIENLPVDLYCVIVTDANACAYQACEFIGSQMSISVETDTAYCGSGAGGTAMVQVIGGVTPYQYAWNNGGTNDTIFNLAPGLYEVTVTADNGCSEVADGHVHLGPGEYDIVFENIDPGCTGGNNGSVTATAQNGYPPYTYSWNTGNTGPTVNNLPAGVYTVTATDSFGCQQTDSTELVMASPITLAFSATDPSCAGGQDGSATVTPANGTPPYQYLWDTSDTTATITDLAAGTYSVFVLDSMDCISFDTVTLTDPPVLTAVATATNVTECGENDGTATVSASGGGMNLPYLFLWSNGDTTQSISGLAPGTYSVTLTDANGCSAQASATVQGPLTLNVSISGTSTVCQGAATGTLTATAANGTAPFTYLWSNNGNTATINNLGAGQYIVTVMSSEGCQGLDTASIGTSPPITFSANVNHVTCFGFSNGAINLTMGGGTPPLSILWSNGSNSTIRNNLSAGNYPFTITDALGCTLADTVEVLQPFALGISFDSSPGSCGSNGFSIAIVTGGTMPYSYLWSNGATTAFIDNLPAGNYSLTVTDANNCQKTASVNIPPYPAIFPNLTSTNTTCNGTTDGTVTAAPTGGVGPFTYLWSNGSTANPLTNLSPNNYTVTVTDAVGCTSIGNAQVLLGNGLNVFINGATVLCPGQTGTLSAMPSGGAPFYTFVWSNGQVTQAVSNLLPGFYSVTASDPNGCSGTASATLTTGGDFSLNSTFENVRCFGENTGRIEVNVTNAAPPVNYIWSNGVTAPLNPNLAAGPYSVTVMDASGCTKTSDFTITQPNLLEVTVTGTDGVCGNLGAASSTVTGGTMPYFYLWSNGSTNPNIGVLLPDTYTLTVTDAKGCTATDFTTLGLTPPVSCSIELDQPVVGINNNNGQITATAMDGAMPYQFLWSNGATTPTNANIGPGIYTLTVTDADNCTTTCNFQLMNGSRVGDFVWEDTNADGVQDTGEPGLENVAVQLQGTDSYGNPVSVNTTSDALGAYHFDLVPGSYQLTFGVPTGFVPSPAAQGGNPSLDSDADPITNKTGFVSLASGAFHPSIDAGYFVEITCDNVIHAGEICCDQSLCNPNDQPLPLSSQAAPSGGTGSLEYHWMTADQNIPFDPLTWQPIANSNSETLPLPIAQTTAYYIRRVRRSGCSQFLHSNIVEVSVKSLPTLSITGTDTLCAAAPGMFSATGLSANATYSWTLTNAVPASANTATVTDVFWEMPGDYTISLEALEDGCPLAASATVHVTNHPDTCGFDLILHGVLTDTMSVLLDWLYPESNTNLRTYLVEWALENSPFVPIGPPDSTGQSGSLVHYFHTHEAPAVGTNFYRVVLNDSQGNTLVSNVVAILKDSIPERGDYNLVHAFPNPFGKQLVVEVYDRFENTPITIEVLNTLGQQTYLAEIPDGTERFEIPTASYPAGAYFLFVRYGGKPQKVFKFVKQVDLR